MHACVYVCMYMFVRKSVLFVSFFRPSPPFPPFPPFSLGIVFSLFILQPFVSCFFLSLPHSFSPSLTPVLPLSLRIMSVPVLCLCSFYLCISVSFLMRITLLVFACYCNCLSISFHIYFIPFPIPCMYSYKCVFPRTWVSLCYACYLC